MNDIEKRIKQINVENFVWIIYIFIIGLCLYANKYEKEYFCTNNIFAKEKYRNITIFIFIIAVIIYIYFFIDNYNDYKDLKPTDSLEKKNLNKLSLVGSTLVLISGLIFLYIAFVDEDLNVEVAFN